MEKRRMFKIMANSKTTTIMKMANKISAKNNVIIIKEPSKSLAMIKMRETVKDCKYYLGEILVSEAIVEINGVKGLAITKGCDFDKVLAMAIIDSGFNNGVKIIDEIIKELLILEKEQLKYLEKENALHLKTMVNFDSMVGSDEN